VILSGNGGYTVADYKTNKDVNTKEEIEIQIGAYAIGLKRRGKNVNLGKIAYLEECEVEDINLDDHKIDEIENKIEDLITGIESKKFEPHVGENCAECDMRKLCRYGGNNE
jgi:CRISPR/Cas system-associated exonuclease Cas4 (RecB family)